MAKKTYKTPGVYIEEVNAFPNSVVAIATAVPAFVGYTEKAIKDKKSVLKKAIKITSLLEYEEFFGGGPALKYKIAEADTTESADVMILDAATDKEVPYSLALDKVTNFYMYRSMQLFYANGGGDAYILSVGNYSANPSKGDMDDGIKLLQEETEPTMLVIPDTMLLESADCSFIQQKMIMHCKEMQNRVAILDVLNGSVREKDSKNVVETFRTGLGQIEGFNYAAAYYPWINTNITEKADIYFTTISDPKELKTILEKSVKDPAPYATLLAELEKENPKLEDKIRISNALGTQFPAYKEIVNALAEKINLLPTAGSIAGVYTRIDDTFNVAKSPANTSIVGLISPAVPISKDQQEDLNVPIDGKAVNAIRTLPGRGTLIWGARTLDGNSQDWRYIAVRRTIIFLEQSIKAAMEAFVFDPNTAPTWIAVNSMVTNFLNNQWQLGILDGTTPAEAFEVAIGLGTTMTPNDILDGYMRMTVKVALIRPAEFIVLTFQQKMVGAA